MIDAVSIEVGKTSPIISEPSEKALDARDLLVIARNVIDLLLSFTGSENDRLVQRKGNEIEELS